MCPQLWWNPIMTWARADLGLACVLCIVQLSEKDVWPPNRALLFVFFFFLFSLYVFILQGEGIQIRVWWVAFPWVRGFPGKLDLNSYWPSRQKTFSALEKQNVVRFICVKSFLVRQWKASVLNNKTETLYQMWSAKDSIKYIFQWIGKTLIPVR